MSGDLTVRQREQKAVENDEALKEGLNSAKIGFIKMAKALYKIEKNEYWLEMGFNSFSQYHCQTGYDISPQTVRRYISLYECFLKYDESEYADLGVNKLELLKNIKHKEQWFPIARVKGYSDLRKDINEKMKGLKPADDEIQKRIEQRVCSACGQVIKEAHEDLI